MPQQKIPRELQAIIQVTSFQLIVMFLLIGVTAGALVSFVLSLRDNLKGGARVWQGFLLIGMVCFSILISYLQFKY